MNYLEATQLNKAHQDLIGTAYQRKTISRLLVAPLKEVGIPKLLYNYANDLSSEKFYQGYNEFEVWVIFDIEDWETTGVMDKMRLAKLLESKVQVTSY
jgi:hypothetical protein